MIHFFGTHPQESDVRGATYKSECVTIGLGLFSFKGGYVISNKQIMSILQKVTSDDFK